jgi:hypothetical protein
MSRKTAEAPSNRARCVTPNAVRHTTDAVAGGRSLTTIGSEVE